MTNQAVEQRNREDRRSAFQAEYEALLKKYNAYAYTWVNDALRYGHRAAVTIVFEDSDSFDLEV